MLKKQLAIVLLSIALITIAVGAVESSSETSMDWNSDDVVKKKLTSPEGLEYTIIFYKTNTTIEISGQNTGNDEELTNAYVNIDGSFVEKNNFRLAPNESYDRKWNLSSLQNPTIDKHQIAVNCDGEYVYFNYTRNLSTLNSSHIPKPYIEDVEFGTTTYQGEKRITAQVTVANPSIHTYPLVLQANTLESNGHQSGAGVPAGESMTHVIPLNETASETVAGEIRLTLGYPGNRSGAFDQVEIYGSRKKGVEVYNESYQPITPSWEPNDYEYENASLEPNGSARLPLPGGLTWEMVWSAVAVVLVAALVGRRLRR